MSGTLSIDCGSDGINTILTLNKWREWSGITDFDKRYFANLVLWWELWYIWVEKVYSTIIEKALLFDTWEPGVLWKILDTLNCKYKWWSSVKYYSFVYNCKPVASESIQWSQYIDDLISSYLAIEIVTRVLRGELCGYSIICWREGQEKESMNIQRIIRKNFDVLPFLSYLPLWVTCQWICNTFPSNYTLWTELPQQELES